MIKLYHAPLTRSIRIYWLLEELGVPYELSIVKFTPGRRRSPRPRPTARCRRSRTTGSHDRIGSDPRIHSRAIRATGGSRPRRGRPRARRFSNGCTSPRRRRLPPLGDIVRHTIFKPRAGADSRRSSRMRGTPVRLFAVVEKALEGKAFLLGAEFSAADIMIGVTLHIARRLNSLEDRFKNLTAYLARLESRPAFQKALS